MTHTSGKTEVTAATAWYWWPSSTTTAKKGAKWGKNNKDNN